MAMQRRLWRNGHLILWVTEFRGRTYKYVELWSGELVPAPSWVDRYLERDGLEERRLNALRVAYVQV